MVDDSTAVGVALEHHYRAHGLPADGGANDSWFRVRLGPVTLPVPNPPARRRAVFFHDVNHVVTGYNTTFSEGEMEIAAFEVGAGCGPVAIAWYINLTMMAIALCLRPRLAFHAFVRGRRSLSLYDWNVERTEVARMSLGDVRRRLALDESRGPARATDRLQFAIWSLIALGVLLAPLALLLASVVVFRRVL